MWPYRSQRSIGCAMLLAASTYSGLPGVAVSVRQQCGSHNIQLLLDCRTPRGCCWYFCSVCLCLCLSLSLTPPHPHAEQKSVCSFCLFLSLSLCVSLYVSNPTPNKRAFFLSVCRSLSLCVSVSNSTPTQPSTK